MIRTAALCLSYNVSVDLAALLVCVLQTLHTVACTCCSSGFLIPGTAVLVQVAQAVDLAIHSSILTRPLVPRTTLLMQVATVHVAAFQGQPCSCRYCRQPSWPNPAANSQRVCVSHGQPCSCAYCKQWMCPFSTAASQTSSLQAQPCSCVLQAVQMSIISRCTACIRVP